MNNSISGEQFLHSKDSSLHRSEPVEHELKRMLRLDTDSDSPEQQATLQKPAHKIAAWLKILDHTHTGKGGSEARVAAQPEVLERIKKSYHREYVINPQDIPESTYELEARIARNMGYGDIPITDEFRQAKSAEIITNQTASLDKWIDYLTSDDAMYPTWAKYWAFKAITKMGKFEKKLVTTTDEQGREQEHEVARFAKRDATTTAPFPTLNPRALALTIGVMQDRLAQKGLAKADRRDPENVSTLLDNQAFQQLASSESFAKLYTQFLLELPEYSTKGLRETRGEWRKYNQGSDPEPLVASIQGYPLEWCTANVDTARTQLQGGDFYVYYSLDQYGEPTIPRVAIRMQGSSIAEIRGIAHNQQLDPYIADVVSAKMNDFPDGESYAKRAADMQRLTSLEESIQQGYQPTLDDLRFLYEIDNKIESFGYGRDSRIDELLASRNAKQDIAAILGIDESQIGTTPADVLDSTTPLAYYYGDLSLDSLTSAEGLTLPQTVGGNLYLYSLTSTAGLTLPQTVGGGLDLDSLTSTEGLTLPQTIGGGLNLRNLTSAEGLTLPQTVGGYLNLYSLTSAEGLTLPQTVGDYLSLDSLTSTEGLTLPQTVGGDLYLHNLTSAEGLTLPQTVGGDLYLDRLTSAEGLTLPQTVGDYLSLDSLTSAEGLTLPQTIGGGLNLRNLTSTEGLTLPQTVGGYLSLDSLTSTEGLTLPQTVGGGLNLKSLTSAEGLTLPQTVGGDLNLYSLTSAAGLILPQTIGGGLNLRNLTSTEGLTLPQTVGGDLYLHNLTSAEGLTLPQTVGGYLSLDSLTSTEGLTLPQTVGGGLNLKSLTSAEGLTLPQTVGGDLNLYSLTSAAGLILPQTIGGGLNLRNLTSTEGLTLPQTVGGYLSLDSLTSTEGLTLPQTVGGGLNLKSLTSAEGLTLPQTIGGGLNLRNLTSTEKASLRRQYPAIDIY